MSVPGDYYMVRSQSGDFVIQARLGALNSYISTNHMLAVKWGTTVIVYNGDNRCGLAQFTHCSHTLLTWEPCLCITRSCVCGFVWLIYRLFASVDDCYAAGVSPCDCAYQAMR